MTAPLAPISPPDLSTASRPFLDWLAGWMASREPLDLAAYLAQNSIEPSTVACISADLVDGFAYRGNLASPRIAAVVEPSAALFTRAHQLGVRHFVLVQEYHTEHALEFHQFGPHCIRGTEEARTVPAMASLPFADTFNIIHKNTLHPAIGTDLGEWLSEHLSVSNFIIVGDCTDLCLYQLMMYLKLRGNAQDVPTTVIVPMDCVQTYDLPLRIAEGLGALPHDGDLMHAIFLYHMALNGALVVSHAA